MIGVHISFQIYVFGFGDLYQGVGLLEHVAILVLVLEKSLNNVFLIATSIYIPTIHVWSFPIIGIFFECYLIYNYSSFFQMYIWIILK